VQPFQYGDKNSAMTIPANIDAVEIALALLLSEVSSFTGLFISIASSLAVYAIMESWVFNALRSCMPTNVTSAFVIGVALSKKAGTNLPWATFRDTIDGAIRARIIEQTLGSAGWPCDFIGAQNVKLRLTAAPPPPPPPLVLRPDLLVAEAELRVNEIQDLAEQLPEIRKIAAGTNLKFRLRLELEGKGTAPAQELVANLNRALASISKDLSLK
jgi:hypothetical protein